MKGGAASPSELKKWLKTLPELDLDNLISGSYIFDGVFEGVSYFLLSFDAVNNYVGRWAPGSPTTSGSVVVDDDLKIVGSSLTWSASDLIQVLGLDNFTGVAAEIPHDYDISHVIGRISV